MTEEFCSLLLKEEFDFRYELGIATRIDTLTIQEKDTTISAMAKHFCVFAVKSELDQILCGLSDIFGVLELLRNNPKVMRPLLVCSNMKHTADSVYVTLHGKRDHLTQKYYFA